MYIRWPALEYKNGLVGCPLLTVLVSKSKRCDPLCWCVFSPTYKPVLRGTTHSADGVHRRRLLTLELEDGSRPPHKTVKGRRLFLCPLLYLSTWKGGWLRIEGVLRMVILYSILGRRTS